MTSLATGSLVSYPLNWTKMQMGLKTSRGEKFLIAIFLLASGVFIYLAYIDWAYDDPFITYRYARNLKEGLGFVYNPGERILSTTTPLFTLLLAISHLFIADIPRLAILIGVISLISGGLLLFDLSRTWNSPVVGWAGLLLYPTFPLLVSTLGSEMPLYLALCIGTFALYARKRYLLAAVVASLACLARPDGILIPVLLAGDYLIRRRGSIPWRAVLVFSGILLAWGAAAWYYFGSPLPVTLIAKQRQGALAISQGFAENFPIILYGYIRWPYILQASLAIIGLLYALWRMRIWTVFLLWPITYFMAYTLLGVSSYYWYYAPLVPGFVIAAGFGLSAIYDVLRKSSRERYQLTQQIAKIISAIILTILVIINGVHLYQARTQIDNRYVIYRAAGEWLREFSNPEDRVGALEVGIIGYFARRSMVDFTGLIQPEVTENLNPDSTYEDAAMWAVNAYHPDYLVLHEGFFTRLEQGYVKQKCDLVQRFNGQEFQYPRNMIIYGCNK
jgi:hypothetical protein